MPEFSDAFFDALGAWQKGWSERPELQAPIRDALLREATHLSGRYKVAPAVMFRKRHLYKSDMIPLIHQKAIDDGACSWTTSYNFAEIFKDEWRPDAITGAILCHCPRPQDIILNIPSLWDDPKFVEELLDYEKRGGEGAAAIRYFRDERNQYEIVAQSPLIITDIVRFSGKVGDIDPVLKQAGIDGEEEIDRAYLQLGANGIYEGAVMKVRNDAAQRIVRNVLEKWAARLAELSYPPSGKVQ